MSGLHFASFVLVPALPLAYVITKPVIVHFYTPSSAYNALVYPVV